VDRFRIPLAVLLITAWNVHLGYYPLYGDHFARLGDRQAIHHLQQWHRWNPGFIVCLILGAAVLYRAMREDEDGSPVICSVASATAILIVIVFEWLLIAAVEYIRYKLLHG
jgi:hypothetical protein